MSYQRQELLTLREHLGSPPVFGGVCVAHLFSFLRSVVFLRLVCLRPVSSVSDVVNVSGLSMLDYPFCFLWRLFPIVSIFSIYRFYP